MTNYVDKIQLNDGTPVSIAGDTFPGQWTYKYLCLASAKAYTGPSTFTDHSLADYLPDNEHDYEVLWSFIVNTTSTSGNCCYLWMYSGASHNYIRMRCGSVIARSAATQNCAQNGIMPIKASDQYLSVCTESGSQTTGNCYFEVYGYRRLGTNKWSNSNLIEKVEFDNQTLQFGGNLLDGKWVVKHTSPISDYTLSAKSANIAEIDLSSYLPTDTNYTYELAFDGTLMTSATNAVYGSIRAYYDNTSKTMPLMEFTNRFTAKHSVYFNAIIPMNSRTLKIVNTGSDNITCNIRLNGYRRLGANV